MPLDTDDIQCVKKCAIWIYRNTNPQAGGWSKRKDQDDFESDPLINEKIKAAELQERLENARTRKLKNDELEGRLLPSDQVEHSINETWLQFRLSLKNLGGTVATLVPGEIKGVTKDMVEKTVERELARAYQDLLDRDPPPHDVDG